MLPASLWLIFRFCLEEDLLWPLPEKCSEIVTSYCAFFQPALSAELQERHASRLAASNVLGIRSRMFHSPSVYRQDQMNSGHTRFVSAL
jgi:hypothetical protein